MLTVGLTGGIASGKSTVARLWEKQGAVVVDTDRLAHEVMSEDDGLRTALVAEFGGAIVAGGEVDRRALANIVFKDGDRLAALNRLVHPPVIERVAKILAEWAERPPAKIGVVQVPLLIEAGMVDMFDVIVVITSNPEHQVRRLLEAGLSESEAINRLRSQIPDWQRLPYADLTLLNKGNLRLLEEQAELLFQKLIKIETENGGMTEET